MDSVLVAPPPSVPARSPLRPPPPPRPISQIPDIMDPTPVSEEPSKAPEEILDESPPLPPPPMTKRHHALHELLSSERAYASDLALIREVHIPLALGQTPNLPISPPASSNSSSSNSSSRTLSTASDSSLPLTGPPPMTPEDVKIIFGNVADLAIFSDLLSNELESALGAVVEGGQGEDTVGELFLRIIPQLEKPFKQYITRHPTALNHLQNLPQSPALTAYLSYTQTVASSLSHAWDIASLLIKPVQRLLKYPLLLGAIIDETPDTHPDKENLRLARARMEEVARNVNEGRRRAEVVKDVLSGNKNKKPPGVGVSVAAGVNYSKMKSLRHGGVTAATMKADLAAAASTTTLGDVEGSSASNGANSASSSHEVAQVEALQTELKRIDAFAQQFARNVVDYSKMMSNLMLALRHWALSFGRVIGLSSEQGSEAFDAFLEVVERQLMPLSVDLEGVINERLLKDTAYLLGTMTQPLKLLASMNEQQPFHYHLLTMPVSAKNRPPPSLLAASTNYLALRGQLAAELPEYIALLHRGLASVVRRLAEIQKHFWQNVRDRWGELWEMLRAEGEWNAGWEETVGVWSTRWKDVDEVVRSLVVCRPLPPTTVSNTKNAAARRGSIDYVVQPGLQGLYPATYGFPSPSIPAAVPSTPPTPYKLEKRHSQRKNSGPNPAAVHSMIASLEPTHSPRVKAASPPSSINVNRMLEPPSATSSVFTTTSSGSNGSGYGQAVASTLNVSGPFALQPLQAKSRNGSGRGRGLSDAAETVSSVGGWGGSISGGSYEKPGKRGSSQDSLRTPRRRESINRGSGYTPEKDRERLTRRRTAGTDEFDGYVNVGYDAYGYAHGQLGPLGHLPLQRRQELPPHSPPPQQQKPGIPRTKSMPLANQAHQQSDKASILTLTGQSVQIRDLDGLALINGSGYLVEGDVVTYRGPPGYEDDLLIADAENWEYYQEQERQFRMQQKVKKEKDRERGSGDKDRDKERGRNPSRPSGSSNTASGGSVAQTRSGGAKSSVGSSKPKSRDGEREQQPRPGHARKRSGSVKSITSFFTNSKDPTNSEIPPTPTPPSSSHRDSWASKPTKYVCQVIHPCKPPAAVSYYSFPFFVLNKGDLYEVLQEAGHPSIHPKLPLYVDDGEDCLLLCRDQKDVVGWALASFLEPVGLNLI